MVWPSNSFLKKHRAVNIQTKFSIYAVTLGLIPNFQMHWCKFWKEEWCQPWRFKILSRTRDIFYTLVSKQQALLKYIYAVDSILIHQYSWLALLTTTTKTTTKKAKNRFNETQSWLCVLFFDLLFTIYCSIIQYA